MRVFAVGPKVEVERWLDSRQHFHDKWFALVDGGLRDKPGTPLIQKGAGDVAAHLLGPAERARPVQTARDLIALPEDAGLWAMLTGSRGAQARAVPPAPNSFAGAVASLGTTYSPQLQYYSAKFPALAGRGVPGRLLIVGLTDTFGRVAVETFAELADRYDAFLQAGVNMARDWQVVCNDIQAFNSASPPRLPGGARCEEQNPVKVGQLRDPDEPARDYAYEATTADAVNMGLIFDPDGRIVSKQVKAYLTPPELPGVGLDLKPGEASGLTAVPTPVGRLGVVTSKDAWMPDVIAKLDQHRVDVLIQPEYFLGNLVTPKGPHNPSGTWNPDVLHASGYNDVLRNPSLEAMVLPEMTGNMLDLSADHQSHIVLRVRSKRVRPGRALVGQPDQRGFAAIARWVVPDPASPGEAFAERRRRLGEAGLKLPYDSEVDCPDPAEAGACRNGQVEDVIFADVEVDRRPRYRRSRLARARTRFSRNRPLAPSRRAQRQVALASRDRRVVAAYEQLEGGRSVVRLARSEDGGRTFPRRPRLASSRGEQWGPSLAVSGGGRVFAAWTDDRSGVRRAYLALSRNGGRSFSRPAEVDRPAGAPVEASQAAARSRQWLPVVAPAPRGRAYLAYLEESGASADDALPQARLHFARVDSEGRIGKPLRLDCQPADYSGGAGDDCSGNQYAAKLDNAWAPSIAAHGKRVAVAWVDFRTYDWRPYVRVSEDGGESFGPERALGGQPLADEQIADTPSTAVDARNVFVAWTDWRKLARTATEPGSAYDTWIATATDGELGPELRADQVGDRQASSFQPAVVAERGDAVVAWQDSATATGDIRVARIVRGARRGRAHRVDDTGRAGANQYRPAMVRVGRRLLVAWEDERDGPMQIYFAESPKRRIR